MFSIFQQFRDKWLLLPLLALVLFMNKPFHIDDAVFLRSADNLPYTLVGEASGPVEFNGFLFEDLSPYESTHPPLIPYFLKLLGVFQPEEGYRFWAYHFFFLVFPILGIYYMRQLLRGEKTYAVAFLVLSPLFFVNATNLMADVPMTVLWIGCIAELVAFDRNSDRSALLRMGILLWLALMTAYQSLALIPLLLCYILLRRRYAAISPLVFASGFFLIFLMIVYKLNGYFPILRPTVGIHINSLVEMGSQNKYLVHKMLAMPICLGQGLFFLTPFLLRDLEDRQRFGFLIGALSGTFLLFEYVTSQGHTLGYHPWELIVLRLLAYVGLLWILVLLVRFARFVYAFTKTERGTRQGLSLVCYFWFFGVLFYNLVLMPYISARYLLPAIPPALLLFFGREHEYAPRSLNWGLAIAGLTSLFLASVDYGQARADLHFFRQLSQRIEQPQNFYFSEDHGLYRYLKDMGANYLPSDVHQLAQGSMVLLSNNRLSPKLMKTMDRREEFELKGFYGFSLHHAPSRTGYYCSHDGLLPFSHPGSLKKAYLCEVVR